MKDLGDLNKNCIDHKDLGNVKDRGAIPLSFNRVPKGRRLKSISRRIPRGVVYKIGESSTSCNILEGRKIRIFVCSCINSRLLRD